MRTGKRILAAALCCLCLLSAAQTGAAAAPAQTSGIQPFWTTISSISLSMTYSNGKVNWEGYISGNSNVTSIAATYTLEKRNSNGTYSSVDSWSVSGSATYLDSSGSKTVATGTYRLTVNVTVTASSGASETADKSLSKTFS
ncbi:MAG: hypothetical protein LBK23_01105 [Oscillospiraceae bacterium]|jgi:hypothetical protein|nr:hypothetical protein [Oscillospiraceae bacterium]